MKVWNQLRLVILDAKVAVLNAQNHNVGEGLGPIETCNSGAKSRCFAFTKLQMKAVGPIETSISDA